ncbi:MAG: NAD(P)-dependent oxidoreductase [Actinomycetota bacterium]
MATLAFCGLGQMGAPMAGRLLDAGHDVTVWNRTPERAEPLRARGAGVGETPADAAVGAEAVFTMLTDAAAVEQVLFGPAGAAEALGPGATVIEMSTIGPGPVVDAAARLPAGVSLLDAPVLGSVPAAEEGSLKIIAGGDPDVFARWREVLEVIGQPTHVGPSGAGAAMKLVANSALGFAMAGLGEALALADRLGLDTGLVLDVLSGGALGVAIERTRASIESGEYPPRFKLELAAKDLGLVDDAGREAGLELRIAGAARSWYDDAAAAGRDQEDYPAVIDHIRRRGHEG